MALVLEVILHWWLLERVASSRILTVGGLSELVVWGLLAVLLVSSQVWRMPERIRWMLTLGLSLWLVAATADLLDEVLVQPLWMSSWMEDLTRVTGMIVVALALLSLMRHAGRVMNDLERLSLVDPLTGLSNRRSFRITIGAREQDGFSLILMDLDHFKAVNDRFGHDVGDQVLTAVAEALQKMRPAESEVFRLGGEEFAMVTEPLSPNDLAQFAGTLRRRIEQLNAVPELDLTLSAGAGTLAPAELLSDLMRRTDQALYRAKEQGRNRIVLAAIEAAPSPSR
jgi:diguanylate cyclase (GGDEF)-like protein